MDDTVLFLLRNRTIDAKVKLNRIAEQLATLSEQHPAAADELRRLWLSLQEVKETLDTIA